MSLKPSRKFYLIPAGALLISGIIAISMIVSFVQSFSESIYVDSSHPYQIDAVEADTLIVMYDGEKLRFDVDINDNIVTIDDDGTIYTYTVTRSGGTGGFDIDSYGSNESSNLNGYEAAFIITFDDEGTYTLSTDAPADKTILSKIGVGEILIKLFGAVAIGFAGGGIALISFLVIIIKRKNYKKKLQSNPQTNNHNPQPAPSEYDEWK